MKIVWGDIIFLWTKTKTKINKLKESDRESKFVDVISTTFMLAQFMNIDIVPTIKLKVEKIKERYNSQFKKTK